MQNRKASVYALQHIHSFNCRQHPPASASAQFTQRIHTYSVHTKNAFPQSTQITTTTTTKQHQQQQQGELQSTLQFKGKQTMRKYP